MYLWQLGVAGGYPGCRAGESGNAELQLQHPITPALLLSALTIHGRGAGSQTKPTEHFKQCCCSPHVRWLHKPRTAVALLCSQHLPRQLSCHAPSPELKSKPHLNHWVMDKTFYTSLRAWMSLVLSHLQLQDVPKEQNEGCEARSGSVGCGSASSFPGATAALSSFGPG